MIHKMKLPDVSNAKKTFELSSCEVCGKTIYKNPRESWPNYFAKKTCSQKCGAKERERAKKDKKNGPRNLEVALREWRV